MDAKERELAQSTPMMRQWYDIKTSLKDDEIVFCRVGDFYELFFDDAERASKALDLQLTKRKIGDGTYPMAGVPHRSIDGYVAKLINQGFKVAIIDQLEDAKKSKGTVKRGLTRIISTGTVTDSTMLAPGMNNYLSAILSIKQGKNTMYGIAVCDVSTGDLRAGTFAEEEKNELLRVYSKYAPVEIIHSDAEPDISQVLGMITRGEELMSPKPQFWFDPEHMTSVVLQHFNVKSMKGFGIEDESAAVTAVGAILKYLEESKIQALHHIRTVRSLEIEDTMTLDATAINSLELFENTQDHTSFGSLLSILDETVTPMGSRLIRHWISNPLAIRSKIEARLNAVEILTQDPMLQHQIRGILSQMGDIERLITRISIGSAKPIELIRLAESLECIPELRKLLDPLEDFFPEGLIQQIDPCKDIVKLIRDTIYEDPSSELGSGRVIKTGYNKELDRLKSILDQGEKWISNYTIEQQQATGIQSIKIKQNNHLGYFLEISKKELSKIPENYIRKQAMVNSSRFVTEELKSWESDILEAEINILEIETTLYQNLLNELSEFTNILQITGQSIAQLDCLGSFAYLADRRSYTRPIFHDSNDLTILAGRHPVIELLNTDQYYVPNDIIFNMKNQRILIVTGPNFSGKSSLLRATALMVIMAHMGCYVPADRVELGIIDRIFTRIGASDNLIAGQSTFMVEMIDAANLVNNSTEKSLVIADELGRGTSTYDGLAIAWAITEYLHSKPQSPKTLIATHYHQLSELEELLPAVKNFQFIISFKDEKPIFDHKLKKGSSDKSFGVEVAKLSGLPDEIIERGRFILKILENKATEINPEGAKTQSLVELIIAEEGQSSLENWFTMKMNEKQIGQIDQREDTEQMVHPVVKKLQSLDIDTMSPIEALKLLSELQQESEDNSNYP